MRGQTDGGKLSAWRGLSIGGNHPENCLYQLGVSIGQIYGKVEKRYCFLGKIKSNDPLKKD